MKTKSVLQILIVTIIISLIPAYFANSSSDLKIFIPIVQTTFSQRIQIQLVEINDESFTFPVEIAHAGDGTDRLFIVEKSGSIRIIKNGIVLTEDFLNIHNLVGTENEQGLLGLAFHPDFVNNGYFYINYTQLDGATIIARYQVSLQNPDTADSNSQTILLTIPQPRTNHNGGKISFGSDGYLYIATGDGGGAGDPDGYGQSTDTLLGKILRIDVDSAVPYGIPADNPYASGGGLPEIWALGLRNPWRFSFDRANGDLYIGDVGQATEEEINYLPASTSGGTNFGWRCFEGSLVFNTEPPCDNPDYLSSMTMPILEYSHAEGQSVTGGYVYRGSQSPTLIGRYFFADFVQGKIWSTYLLPSGQFTDKNLELDTNLRISCFGEDETGELYLADYSSGKIFKIIEPP